MKLGRGVVFSLAAVLLATGLWVVGGNAWAARRERAVARGWDATFGPREALVGKYTVAETNASARRLEELAMEIGLDLALFSGRWRKTRTGLSEDERGAVGEYVDDELKREGGAVAPPPDGVARLLASRGATLDSLEKVLLAAPPPRWECSASAWAPDRPRPPVLGFHVLQRLFAAESLRAAAAGDAAAAARALDAAWVLDQALVARPEMMSQIIATAGERLEAGALRRVGGRTNTWSARLDAMGSRRRLVEANFLESEPPGPAGVSRPRPSGVGWWWANGMAALKEPIGRTQDSDYFEGWVAAMARLRDAPAFRDGPDTPFGSRVTQRLLATSLSNVRNAFDRVDRVALDAELTGKVLNLEEARHESRAWPAPSPEISSSRFPGLSWSYRVEGDSMTIALNRDLPNPYPRTSLALPLSFSSSAPGP